MEIDVLLFGPASDAAGADRVRLSLHEGCSAADALAILAERQPRLRPFVECGRLAVNHAFAPPATLLRPGDEVALIAMVSGG